MYNQAIEDGITEKNPGGWIGKLNKRDKDKPKKKKIDPLTREEVAVLLKTAREVNILTGIPYSCVLAGPARGSRRLH